MFMLSDEPMVWIFAGDSITQGAKHTHGQRCWVEHVQERVRWQLGHTLDLFVNSGVSGWDAATTLANFDWLVGQFKASVISIALGMNDAVSGPPGRERFRADLTQLVRNAVATGAAVVLHTPNSIAVDGGTERGDLAAYAQIVRTVAVAESVVLVDHFLEWTRRSGPEPPPAWLNDPIHPNWLGHRVMASLTLQTLGLGDLDEA